MPPLYFSGHNGADGCGLQDKQCHVMACSINSFSIEYLQSRDTYPMNLEHWLTPCLDSTPLVESRIDLHYTRHGLYETKDDCQRQHHDGYPECVPLHAVPSVVPPL